MEKAYRVMRNSGAGNIAIGIILLVTGVNERKLTKNFVFTFLVYIFDAANKQITF